MILNIKNIAFRFSSAKQVLKGISLTFDRGEIYALVGSNGAGKTTLFNLIAGFIKPQMGEIFFGEKNITLLQPFEINKAGISRTFQDLRLIKKLTVKENIILAMQNNPTDNWLKAMLPVSFDRDRKQKLDNEASDIIERFFLSEVRNSLAAEISYGQQKLLSFACCVANGAPLLLLDEPVAGIQPEYRDKIAVLIKQLKEKGKTILLIEHNTDFIADVADQIFFLHEAKISRFNSMEALKKDKQVMEAYI